MNKKDHSQIKKLEYNKITDGLYIGTNYCCRTHFEKTLLAKGIKVDISLEAERIDNPFGVKTFLWLPTKNHHAPTKLQLQLGAEFLHDVIPLKLPVYVHCQNGHGRAPTLVAAFLVSSGMSVNEAVAFIKKRRPSIHPNAEQIKALETFRKSLNKKRPDTNQ